MDAQLSTKIQKITGVLAREEAALGRSFPAPDSSLRHSLSKFNNKKQSFLKQHRDNGDK